ncbi:MAG: hypothetical protein KKE73_10900 [Proteobacteria bacterium]|nr:hypothetical protein [Pseudomonadota bacterium]
MTRAEEAAFEKKAEQHFKGYRPVPDGRNFRFWKSETGQERENFRNGFDRIQWDKPHEARV